MIRKDRNIVICELVMHKYSQVIDDKSNWIIDTMEYGWRGYKEYTDQELIKGLYTILADIGQMKPSERTHLKCKMIMGLLLVVDPLDSGAVALLATSGLEHERLLAKEYIDACV